ncbi:hypothetical protein LG634_12240 [Streptomyces bambusae]|uniref:hypothetical protein n=1 Tax=Streptomyces bambusae TaxID=1550616 RepID=UPI001CFE9EC3|nr:hypothetical protein [Streptomyces bambusae]MCB5165600.1 hypothetical protein [Streptomyces bambusae]
MSGDEAVSDCMADRFEYSTYTSTPEICPGCLLPVPAGALVRRRMRSRPDGLPPLVTYWHTHCVRTDGTPVNTALKDWS